MLAKNRRGSDTSPIATVSDDLAAVLKDRKRTLRERKRAARRCLDHLQSEVSQAQRGVDKALAGKPVSKLNKQAVLGSTWVELNRRRHDLDPTVQARVDTTGKIDVEQGWVFKSQHDRRQIYLHVEGSGWAEVGDFRGFGGSGMLGIDTTKASWSDIKAAGRSGDSELGVRRFAADIVTAARALPIAAKKELCHLAEAESRAAGATFALWYEQPEDVTAYNAEVTRLNDVRHTVDSLRSLVGEAGNEREARRAQSLMDEAARFLDAIAPISRPQSPGRVRPAQWGALRHLPNQMWQRAKAPVAMSKLVDALDGEDVILALLGREEPRALLVAITHDRLLVATSDDARVIPHPDDLTWQADADTIGLQAPSADLALENLVTTSPDQAHRVLTLIRAAVAPAAPRV